MKINLSTKSGSVSGGSWSPAIVAAWADLDNTGGTLYFDDQLITVKGASPMQTVSLPVPLQLVGDGSSEVQLEAGSSNIIFTLGNLTNAVFRDLVFSGKGADSVKDCSQLINASYVLRLLIENCRIAGVRANSNIINLGTGVSAKIRDSQLSGCAGVVVGVDGAFSLDLDNCEFLDYIQIAGTYHSKTPAGAAWIRAANPPALSGTNSPSIRVANSRFDEGSLYGIEITDYPAVEISQCKFNINNSTSAAGIKLTGVAHAILKQNHVGYNAVNAPLIKLVGCTNVVVVGQGRDSTPYRIETDSASAAGLKVLQSPGVTVTVV